MSEEKRGIAIGTLTVIECESGRSYKGYFAGENETHYLITSPQVKLAAITKSKVVSIIFYDAPQPEEPLPAEERAAPVQAPPQSKKSQVSFMPDEIDDITV